MGQRLKVSTLNRVLKQAATLFFFTSLEAVHDMAWMFYLQALYLSVYTSVELAVVSAPFASVIYCGHDRQKTKTRQQKTLFRPFSSEHLTTSRPFRPITIDPG